MQQDDFAPQAGWTREQVEAKRQAQAQAHSMRVKLPPQIPVRSWEAIEAAIRGALQHLTLYHQQEPNYPTEQLLMDYICLTQERVLDDDKLWLLYRCSGVVHLANYQQPVKTTNGVLLNGLRWVQEHGK